MDKPRIGIIGAGKVGHTLARLWHRQGYSIVGIASRTPAHAEALAQQVDTDALAASDVIVIADIIFLTVADDAIEPVAQSLAEENWQDKAAVHCSGAASVDVLQSLAEAGAQVGSLHPAFPFADVDSAMQGLSGATFAIEASETTLQAQLTALAESIGGQTIQIPAGGKAAYHAALCIASNYTVTLYSIAQSLLTDLGADEAAAINALDVLMQATVENLAAQGIPDALTGPLSRGDAGTLRRHLTTLDDATLREVYVGLARLSYPMLDTQEIDLSSLEKIWQDAL